MLRSADLETGNNKTSIRRRRRKSFWRLPISVAFSALMIFLFFVTLGTRKSTTGSTKNKRSARPKKINQGQPTLYTYAITAEFPHDASAFTQGLEYYENCEQGSPCKQVFIESTGLNGQSTVREVDILTGNVLRSRSLPKTDFGEGITRLGDTLYQLTWQSGKAWSYKADDFDEAPREFKTLLNDGWGITSNSTHLFVGDSSDILYVLDPDTMQIVQELQITDGKHSVKWVNELEWVDGLIYANIYTTECIAQIDPNTGTIVGWMVLDGLKSQMMDSIPENQRHVGNAERMPDVLNGIAWDTKNSRLFVTGKLWPKMYQIESRPMYLDSKATDVAGIMENIRSAHSPFSDQKTMYLNVKDTANELLMASGRIFLGRLREDVDRQILVDVLSKFGNVLDARIVAATKDGYRKRFAFCDLETMESATAAIQALHGSTDLGEPALIATHSTDTQPSPIWNSTGPSKYYDSSIAASATFKHQQQSSGSNPSAYGLAWQASRRTTTAVAAPPPPPRPAPGTQNNCITSSKSTAALESAMSSSSSSFGGVAAPQHVSPPILPAADAAAPQLQEQQHPHHQGLVPVPPHMMQHSSMPMPIATAGPGQAIPHQMMHPTPAFDDSQLTTLYVRGLPIEMDEMGLLHYYMPFGSIVATKILRNLDSMRSRGAGFIEFFSRQDSDAALRGTHRVMGPAGRELMVQYAPRQLHTSRGTGAAMSAPVWPVMPYPAAAAAAAAVSGPAPVPVVGVPSPPIANGSPGHTPHHQAAVAMGHPMPLQAYPHVPYPYHQQGPFPQPAHGTAAPAGWQQQQHTYPHPHPHQQHQYYGYQNYQYHHNNALLQHEQQQQYAITPAAPAAYQQQKQQQKQQVSHSSSKPASIADSASSDTNSNAVLRPGEPVVVVYGNLNKHEQQQEHDAMNNNNQASGNNKSINKNFSDNGGGLAVRPAHYTMTSYPATVHGGRYPLRNLSNMNGGSSGGSHSAASTPGRAMPLDVPSQKHTGNSGGDAGGGGTESGKESGNSALCLERTSSDPFPSALSASEMNAICSRVKAAARNVIQANNAMAADKKFHEHGSDGGVGDTGTPDLVVKRVNNSNAASSSVITLDSEDSLDSVASCETVAAVIVPAASGVPSN